MTSESLAEWPLVDDPWGARLGVRAVPAGQGPSDLVLDLNAGHMNFLDGAHGGVLFSLAQLAMLRAARESGTEPRLLDAHVAFTAGGTRGDAFFASVTPIKVGRSLGVYRVTVTKGEGVVVGEFTGTVRFNP
jgi:uncharacterized protein (TIGR00369 family)